MRVNISFISETSLSFMSAHNVCNSIFSFCLQNAEAMLTGKLPMCPHSSRKERGGIFLCVTAKPTFFQHNKNLLHNFMLEVLRGGGNAGKDGRTARRLVSQKLLA